MNIYLKYIILCFFLIVIDAIWIYSNLNAYFDGIRKVQNDNIIKNNLYAAILAYIVMVFALIHIAIPLTLYNINNNDTTYNKLYKSFIYGGAVGFSIYALYNLTSLALYKDFPIIMALIDTLWGTFLYTMATFLYISLN